MRLSFSLLSFALLVSACTRSTAGTAASDSAFTAVQERGTDVMGVDQYTSQHVFEDLPDGGRVVLERDDASDTAAITVIRAHMRAVLSDFQKGDFSKPFHVHAMEVPGTDVMRSNAAKISYSVADRPRGAELRISTQDSAVLGSIRKFLAFQRQDHRAGGHDM